MGWVRDGASGSVRRRVYVIFLLLELRFKAEEEVVVVVVGMAPREKCGGEERICGERKRVPKLIVLGFLLGFRWWW